MRTLKIATIAMGVLIVLGVTVIIATIVKRGAGVSAGPDKAFAAVFDEPTGTEMVGITQVHDRLAIQLRGGGADRVLLIDPVSGSLVGQISLSR